MSPSPPAGGDGLRRAVDTMDVLRSPGGCPWDAAQTHESLTRYLVEECYEVLEAIETGDRALLREELGDLLLQVLFHARLAQKLPPDEAFGIDEVAGDLADKLVDRHPHVFAREVSGATQPSAAALDDVWEARKIVEKNRTSALDGVPIAQPALALAAKLVARVRRAGLEVDVDTAGDSASDSVTGSASAVDDERIGRALFTVVADAVTAGVDPEGALRRVLIGYRQAVRDAERGASGRASAPPEMQKPAR